MRWRVGTRSDIKTVTRVVILGAAMAFAGSAQAQLAPVHYPQTQFSEEHHRIDLAFGAVAAVDDRFGYLRTIFAPDDGLYQPGLRLNLLFGAGAYRLDNGEWVDKSLAQALVGWALWSGNRGAAVYSGIAYEDHGAPITQAKSGEEVGVAVRGDVWWRINEATLVSAGIGYTQTHDTISGRIAIDRQVARYLRATAEASFGNDVDGTHWSAGAGGTAHVYMMEATVIVGASGDDDDTAFTARAEVRVRR